MEDRKFSICSKDSGISIKIDGISTIYEMLELLNSESPTFAVRIIGTVVQLEKKHISLVTCKYSPFELYHNKGNKLFTHASFEQHGISGMLIVKTVVDEAVAVLCSDIEEVKPILNNKFIFAINVLGLGEMEYMIYPSSYIKTLNSEWNQI